MFYFCGALVHWFSKVQRSISFSSTEAEMYGAMMAGREIKYLRNLLVELGHIIGGPTPMYTDNKSCIELSIDPVAFKKTKHILLAAEGLRDYAAKLTLEMRYVAGSVNVADILTKGQSPAIFAALMAAHDALVGGPVP